MSTKIKLNLQLTRPTLVPSMVAWVEGVGEYMERAAGKGMTEHAVYFKHGVTRSFRGKRTLSDLRRFVRKHPEIVLNWLQKYRKVYKNLVNEGKFITRAKLIRHPDLLESFYQRSLDAWVVNAFAFWIPQIVKKQEISYGKEIIRLALKVRKQLDVLVFISNFYRRIIHLIAKDEKLLSLCRNGEIVKYLKGALNTAERRRILKRQYGWIIFKQKSKLVRSFAEARQFLLKLGYVIPEEEQTKHISSFYGTIVYRGVKQGRVVVLRSYEDNAKAKRGNIVVSPMTTPAFMPAIVKAAAIVTDEGGITCHAAIISRELRKPCITGTKIATKVLKDGDIVEVNGNLGEVTVIKKSK